MSSEYSTYIDELPCIYVLNDDEGWCEMATIDEQEFCDYVGAKINELTLVDTGPSEANEYRHPSNPKWRIYVMPI